MLQGTSTGACRRIVSGLSPTTECNATTISHGLCPETHFSFDRPFPSPLDGKSLVSIMPFVGHMAFNGNDYSDGGEVQFYATALECVASENKLTRTGGRSAWAREDEGKVWNPNLRMTFLDNEIVEGNHVWNVRVPQRFVWACVSSPANLVNTSSVQSELRPAEAEGTPTAG